MNDLMNEMIYLFRYECFKGKCDYYLSVDSDVRLDNPMTLKLLIEQNRPIVAPMLKHANRTTWNFSGKMPSKGLESAVQHKYAFYPPYMDIIKNNRRWFSMKPLNQTMMADSNKQFHKNNIFKWKFAQWTVECAIRQELLPDQRQCHR